jgi:hypothetical protein
MTKKLKVSVFYEGVDPEYRKIKEGELVQNSVSFCKGMKLAKVKLFNNKIKECEYSPVLDAWGIWDD